MNIKEEHVPTLINFNRKITEILKYLHIFAEIEGNRLTVFSGRLITLISLRVRPIQTLSFS